MGRSRGIAVLLMFSLLDDVLVVLRQSSRYFGKRSKGGHRAALLDEERARDL